MIRRSFLKALCASPLGFLVKKKPLRRSGMEYIGPAIVGQEMPKGWVFNGKRLVPTALADNGIPSWTTNTSSNDSVYCWIPYTDYIKIPRHVNYKDIHTTFDGEGKCHGWYWKIS